ncbi:hypothetical protein [Hydrogenophaga sp.]|uniref:hypothetical protein n=1 Tax=Hydrogenophaga sp. TaxID=1904254 RepID=UPI002736151F|nr:hypothetical protein [Hydrogenophaga sp.]MDP3107194.1 hypothetical protein [Hydrogenophaga sp.]
MAIDLNVFAQALRSRSDESHLVLILAPREELVCALADSPEALAAARTLGWDHPGVRVGEMIAEADALLARRSIDELLARPVGPNALELRQLLMRGGEIPSNAAATLADDPSALLTLRESVLPMEPGTTGAMMAGRVHEMLARVDAELARRAMDGAL